MGKRITLMIEEQVEAWKRLSSRGQPRPHRKKRHPVITISREFGALGAALAVQVGKRLRFKVWDGELLQAIARELGSEQKFLKTVDERRRKPVEDNLAGFLKNINTNVNYLRALVRVVHDIENQGSSIIVGRGANYICERPDSFHIRVVCPLKTRIRSYAKREGITRPEAREIILKKDAERADFILYNFDRDVTVPSDYNLILNSGTFDLEEMADIVLEAYAKKTAAVADSDFQQDRL